MSAIDIQLMTALYNNLSTTQRRERARVTSADFVLICSAVDKVFFGLETFEEAVEELVRAVRRSDNESLAEFLREQAEILTVESVH